MRHRRVFHVDDGGVLGGVGDLEDVAAAALDRKYEGQPVPDTFPAHIENAVIGYSIAISLKRIADLLDGTTLGVSVSDTLFNTKR